MNHRAGLLLLDSGEIRIVPQEGVSSRQELVVDDVVHTCSDEKHG